ncbi:MAG: LptF/LptG family permease [Candidatus Aureabacteria bacterium]|nr:LptF/LptG family permease [Candidatus Auribacterota bacterium]
MGRILFTYLFKNFWSTFLLVLFTFLSLIFIVDLMDKLDEFMSYGLPFKDYILYCFYTIPPVIVYCLPFSVLLSALRLLHSMSLSNEYTSLIMGGISLNKIMLPFFMSAFFLSAVSFFLNDQIAPETRFRQRLMQREKFKLNQPYLKNINLTGKDGKKYYLHEYHKKEKKISGFMITETDAFGQLQQRVFAEEMIWHKDHWSGNKVQVQPYSNDGLPAKAACYETIIFKDIPKPEEILVSKVDPTFMNARLLKKLIKTIPENKEKIKKGLMVDYYRKFSLAFLPLVFLFLAIPFGITHEKEVSSKAIGAGVIVCLVYYLFDVIFYQAGKGLLISPLLSAWMSHVLFLLTGVILIRKVPH